MAKIAFWRQQIPEARGIAMMANFLDDQLNLQLESGEIDLGNPDVLVYGDLVAWRQRDLLSWMQTYPEKSPLCADQFLQNEHVDLAMG